MSKSQEHAATILLHYIEVALTNAGVTIDADMRAEFADVVEAFREPPTTYIRLDAAIEGGYKPQP